MDHSQLFRRDRAAGFRAGPDQKERCFVMWRGRPCAASSYKAIEDNVQVVRRWKDEQTWMSDEIVVDRVAGSNVTVNDCSKVVFAGLRSRPSY